MKQEKTNVIRILEQKKIPYESVEFASFESTNGEEIARHLGEDPDQAFKTLVTVGKSGQHFVFVIPVNRELHLKKAAKACGEKSIDMIKQKELLPLTGYIHGGCSPIGMKKQFPTFVQESAQNFDQIYFSAGKVGYQVKVAPQDLARIIPLTYGDVCQ
jgi:Cys-tRNA(Pro)/Cys-tRNA(Cys) deacylase